MTNVENIPALICATVALLSKAIYKPVDVSKFSAVVTAGEDTVGIARRDDGLVYIIGAGTENWRGWESDADIETVYIPGVGPVHAGFNQNTDAFVLKIAPLLRPVDDIVVGGHSRGAPIAAIIGAKLKMAGYNVMQAVLLACPNFCFPQGAKWFAENMLIGSSYRNAPHGMEEFGDPVPLVPLPNPFQPWMMIYSPRIMIDRPPAGIERDLDVYWHSIDLYCAGIVVPP